MANKVEFFFDLVSPYSYLAETQIRQICQRSGGELRFRPFLLGGVFKASENQAPLNVPAKGGYMTNDLEHWASYYQIPLNFPRPFPFTTVATMRAAFYAEREGKLDEFVRAAYETYWVDGESPSGSDRGDEDAALKTAAGKTGLDPEQTLAAASEDEFKQALTQNTEEAVERGAFGAPTFFVTGNNGESDGEMFWGNDRLHFVERALKG